MFSFKSYAIDYYVLFSSTEWHFWMAAYDHSLLFFKESVEFVEAI